jgi:hypothetical protein
MEVKAVMAGPPKVGLDGAATQPFDLDEAKIVLIPRSRRECSDLFSYAQSD